MNVLPVISRELRAQARQGFTYGLRMLGGAALIGTLFILMFRDDYSAGHGVELFVKLHWVLLASIWLLIPLSTADCISRERREGTLGLLFLTPLKPRDIVIAKSIAHVLRAFTLWLASLPMQVLPFLVGGVTWQCAVISCTINFCSILFAVGVSVVASALCRRAQRAMGLTVVIGAVSMTVAIYVISVVAVLGFWMVLLLSPSGALVGGASWWPSQANWFDDWAEVVFHPAKCFEGFFYVLTGAQQCWTEALSRMPPVVNIAFYVGFAVGALVSVIASALLLTVAAWIVRLRWRDPVRSVRSEKMERTFLKPVVAQDFLRRWLRRSLDRNPIGWLERRSWSGRMVVWVWFAVLVSVYSLALTEMRMFMYSFQWLQQTMSLLLVLSMAATAAGSFRRERETGVLELLLVSPLSEWSVITGRLRGIWMQFLPSVGLLVFMWFFTALFLTGVNPIESQWLIITFITLPVVGLYLSLAQTNFLPGFLGAVAFAELLPRAISNLPFLFRSVKFLLGLPGRSAYFYSTVVYDWMAVAAQFAVAGLLLMLMHRNLVERRFAMETRTT